MLCLALTAAVCLQSPTTDSSTAESFVERPPAEWPQIVLHQRASFRGSSDLERGNAFLGRMPDGRLVGVTARHLLGIAGNVTPEIDVRDLPRALVSWELFVPRDTESTLALDKLASSGFDHWSSDVVMMTVDAEPPTPLPAIELPLRAEPLAVGESLTLVGAPHSSTTSGRQATLTVAVGEVFEDGVIEFDVAPGTVLDGWSGAPLVDAQGRAAATLSYVRATNPDDAPNGFHPAEPPAGLKLTGGAHALGRYLSLPPRLDGLPVPAALPPASLIDVSAARGQLMLAAPPMGRALLYDLETFEQSLPPESLGRATAAAFSPDGYRIAGVAGPNVRLVDLNSGELLVDTALEMLGATLLAVSPKDGSVIVGSGFAEDLRRVTLDGAAPVKIAAMASNELCFEPGGDSLLVAGDDGHLVRLAPSTGEVLQEFDGLESTIWCVDVTDDGTRVAAGDDEGNLVLFDAESGAELERWSGGNGAINDIVFAYDGRVLVAATGTTYEDEVEAWDEDCYVRVFDTVTGAELARSHDHARYVERLASLPTASVGPSAAEHQVLSLAANGEAWVWRIPGPVTNDGNKPK